MRVALSDHKNLYGEPNDEVSRDERSEQEGECTGSLIVADADIPGLSLVDFGSILGISLLSCAAHSSQQGDATQVINLSQDNVCSEAIMSENSYFVRHSSNVARYSLAMADAMRLPVQKKKAIFVAGFLHDIGKLQVAPSVFYKKGPLTPEEYEKMKMHPFLAVKMLSNVTFPWPIKPLILYHHERCDGSGYPEGLVRDEIPLGARIIGVADFVDAFSSKRLYQRAHSLDELVERIIVYSMTIFDDVVCTALMDLIESGVLRISQESEEAEEMGSDLEQTLFMVDGKNGMGYL